MCKLPNNQLFQLLKDLEMKAAQNAAEKEAHKQRIFTSNKEAAKNILLGIQLQLARRAVSR